MVRDQQLAIHVCPYRPDETSRFGLPAAHPAHLWPTTATHTGRKFPKLLPPVGGSRWYKEERIGSRRGVPEIDLTGPGR